MNEVRKKSHPLVCHFEESHEGEQQTLLMRTLVETRTALERQSWESVMIDRLSRDPKQCLNLKNEWSMSMKPALENKRKAKDSGETGKEHSPSSETMNQKRGRQESTEVRDTGQEVKERPGKKRKHFEVKQGRNTVPVLRP